MSIRRFLGVTLTPLAVALLLAACGGGSKSNNSGVTISPAGSPSAASSSAGGASGTATSGSSGSSSSTPGSSSSSSSSGGGSTASNSELAGLFSNFTKVKSFRATLTISGGTSGSPTGGTMEVVVPDKEHFTLTGGGGAIGNIELISIGNDSYTKVNGTWTKSPGTGAGRVFDPSTLNQQFQKDSSGTNVVKGGTDTVNGTKCQLYTSKNTDSSTDEICIANGLPIRVKSTNEANVTTIIFSDYNSNIDIKAPI